MNLKKIKKSNKSHIEVLGLPVNIYSDALDKSIELHSRGGGQIITLNAEMVIEAQKNEVFLNVIKKADIVIPDGSGVAWAINLKGIKAPQYCGIDLGKSLLKHAEENLWKVAFIGSAPETIKQLKKNLSKEFPKLKIAIASNGFLNEIEWERVVNQLRSKKPDLILVALGSPRQELWIKETRKNLRGIWIGIGGSFDIWSGTKKRAPKSIRRLKLEWLFRLYQEPSRWRRTLSLTTFVWKMVNESNKA